MIAKSFVVGALALTAAACAGTSSAQAGAWKLDPRLCPDLREDVRDARVTTSRRDLREDRRDRRVTNCPARAWVYTGHPGKKAVQRPALPRYSAIYVDKKGRYYGTRNGKRVRIRIAI